MFRIHTESAASKYVRNIEVKFIQQKLATAVAISILKCKPTNISAIDFCKIIQANLSEKLSPPVQCFIASEENHNNTEQNTICNKDLSQILNNETYSAPVSLQTSQVFQEIINTTSSEKEENSEILQNFDTLQAVNNVKRIICNLNGDHSFNGVNFDDFKLYANNLSSQNTQDSGYYSSQLSGAYICFKKKESEMTHLNASLKLLVNFMINASDKYLNTSIANYISEVFGRAIDILYDHNIYLSSFDDVVDSIDEVMNQIFNKKHIDKISSQEKCIFTFFMLNKSSLLIQHSLMQLTNELQHLLDKLSRYGALQVLEIREPTFIDSSFFIFNLLERLLRQCIENQSKKSSDTIEDSLKLQKEKMHFMENFMECDNIDEHIKKENDAKLLKQNYTRLLNRAVLECVETYPLISFWAMECLNIEK